MSRAVLEIDMPESCYECDFVEKHGGMQNGSFIVREAYCRIIEDEEVYGYSVARASFCPLKPKDENIPTKCKRCGIEHMGDCDDGHPPFGGVHLIFDSNGARQLITPVPPEYPLWRKVWRYIRRKWHRFKLKFRKAAK